MQTLTDSVHRIGAGVRRRADNLYGESRFELHAHTDRMFAGLMAIQWIAGIVAAVVISPRTWSGAMSQMHIHVWTAVLVGGAISSLPIALALLRPGKRSTRYVIAGAQMLTSALLIHLTGGRIETHFHVFGSLAFLSFYRDWRVLVPATAVIALDHMLRGMFWPESVFGVLSASQWRWIEHACWVIFEDIVLVRSCLMGAREMRVVAARQAQLEASNETVEAKVREQTSELRASESLFRSIAASSPVGIFRTTADSRRLTYVNERCVSITGRSRHELDGSDLLDEIHPDDRDAVMRDWGIAMDTSTEFSRECRLACSDGGATRWIHLRASPQGGDEGEFVGTLEDITSRKRSEGERARLTAVIEQVAEAIFITDVDGTIRYVNPAFEKITGYSRDDVLGAQPRILKSGVQDNAFYADMWTTILSGNNWVGAFTNRKKDGKLIEVQATISPIRDSSDRITNFAAITRDMTEQRALEQQLGQSQKLEAIGQLAAGIAHEINTPTQYVGDNTRFLQDSFEDIVKLFGRFDSLFGDAAEATPSAEDMVAMSKAIEDADLEYLTEEIPRAVEQSLDGVNRVTRIVRAMKEFSHPSEEKTLVDLNRAIDSTITVASNEWKYVAELETDFDKKLETVPCVPGDINQTILNMIVNAAHAIADVVGDGGDGKGKIKVATRLVDEWAEIRIADTGGGIPEDLRRKIFDPFFTTKQVGKGTGQGLSIAHSMIVQKHGGTIDVRSEIGRGTTFIIRLPMAESEVLTEGAAK